ncbi:MAG: leucine-rich repeat domain-containing protein [Clostridia bacterium]|nr:leucine-rich repeat domain-containing protein [Clostridia bacterium]
MKGYRLLALALSAAVAAGAAASLAACSSDSCRHELTYYPAVEATCQGGGCLEYWQCDLCGKYFTDEKARNETTLGDLETPATNHSYKRTSDLHAATCSEGGYYDTECIYCGTQSRDYVSGALGHLFESDDAEYCSRCGQGRIGMTLSEDGGSYIVTGLNDTTITDVAIPSEYTAQGEDTALPVTAIGDEAFMNVNTITSVSLPETVTSIGNYAFHACNGLTEISIPGGSVGSRAFSECKNLKSVIFGDAAPVSIGQLAFYYDQAMTDIDFEGEVEAIGTNAFGYCTALECVSIPGPISEIGESAFDKCTSLAEVSLPDSLETIGERAFYGCSSLTSAALGSGLKTIETYAFYGCPFQSITLPEGLETIGDDAFMDCNALESIILPDSVTELGFGVFYLCTSLKEATIGSGVISMGNSVFFACSSLESVTFKVTAGWSVSDAMWNSTVEPVYTPVDSSMLEDPATAAETVSGYAEYRWQRS